MHDDLRLHVRSSSKGPVPEPRHFFININDLAGSMRKPNLISADDVKVSLEKEISAVRVRSRR